MMNVRFLFLSLFLSYTTFSICQEENYKTDKGIFKTYEPGYYQNTILKGIKDYKETKVRAKERKYFAMDFSNMVFPVDSALYDKAWHADPVSQGRTGTCWCFATISFFESEIKRKTGQQIKLSEMYIVYWEYVERARAFVINRGDVYFAEGSEASSVPRIMDMHGIVPFTDYSGLLEGQKFHDHSAMFEEMDSYLISVKENALWNENEVLANIKSILNTYLGEPPSKIDAGGISVSPRNYLRDILRIDPQDFFNFMCTLEMPYNEKGELVEPDNWWHCDDYYNLDLSTYFSLIRNAIKDGYTISICGDVSEPAYDRHEEVGIIPDFDIPSDYINAYSRQYRLSNNTTTDDHCIHLIGYYYDGEECWFMIKDSGSGGFDGPTKGYRYLHEDYVKLKMMNVMMHKEAAEWVLKGILK